MFPLADEPRGLESIDGGHEEVHECEAVVVGGSVLRHETHGFCAVACDLALEAPLLHVPPYHFLIDFVICKEEKGVSMNENKKEVGNKKKIIGCEL